MEGFREIRDDTPGSWAGKKRRPSVPSVPSFFVWINRRGYGHGLTVTLQLTTHAVLSTHSRYFHRSLSLLWLHLGSRLSSALTSYSTSFTDSDLNYLRSSYTYLEGRLYISAQMDLPNSPRGTSVSSIPPNPSTRTLFAPHSPLVLQPPSILPHHTSHLLLLQTRK